MKKFYIYNEAAAERNAVYFDFDGNFEHVLCADYIMETGGDPVTSEEQDTTLEELMAHATSDITDCDNADEEYIMGLCEAWGLI